MLYQTAKSELQSPPHSVSWTAIAIEVVVILGISLAMSWWI